MGATTAQSTKTAFAVQSLHKEFRLAGHRIPVLRGVDLTVPKGRWVALVGRSGSGKTTLLQLLGALDKPTSGDILCLGKSYATLSSAAKTALRMREIGFVFQSYHLFPELTAHENVVLPALRWHSDRRRAGERARQLLEQFGLGHRLKHRPRELSGGEQQRVALCRALINDPGIILADEPTGNLDVAAGKEIVAILQNLHREEGKTIVMVTHDPALARLAEDVYVMRDGRAAHCPDREIPEALPTP